MHAHDGVAGIDKPGVIAAIGRIGPGIDRRGRRPARLHVRSLLRGVTGHVLQIDVERDRLVAQPDQIGAGPLARRDLGRRHHQPPVILRRAAHRRQAGVAPGPRQVRLAIEVPGRAKAGIEHRRLLAGDLACPGGGSRRRRPGGRLGRHRGGHKGGGQDARQQTRNQSPGRHGALPGFCYFAQPTMRGGGFVGRGKFEGSCSSDRNPQFKA